MVGNPGLTVSPGINLPCYGPFVVPKGAHFFRDAAKNRAAYEQSQRNAREANKKEWAKPAPSNGIAGAPSSLKREAPSGHASKAKRIARS